MPKLPAPRARHPISFLRYYGFLLDHAAGSHFVFRHPATRRRAVVSRHNKDLVKGTIFSILQEAGFSRDDLLEFLHGIV